MDAPDSARADEVFNRVLRTQEDFAAVTTQHNEARAARDQAIIDAAEFGFPRRALAQATNLTVGRVQQIVDQARERPDLQPALKMERDRRQRSRALAELLERDRDGA